MADGADDLQRLAAVETPFGVVGVVAVGSQRVGRPALLCFPDVGHTAETCFGALFAHEEMADIARNFLRLNIEPPGMQPRAPPFPAGYQYPSLEQLAETIPYILQHFSLKSIIGMGVGAGAFVLAKYGLSGLTSSTTELIMGHLFTQEEVAAAAPPVQEVRENMENCPNVGLYWAMYNSRGDLGLERNGAKTLRCPVLLVVGDNSPHEDAVVSGRGLMPIYGHVGVAYAI
ncbi:protein NDRG2-like [Coturnix japonica]|uniref:protein NDRG2-like n=1 Tax=Coturnix japonica TaxID=93934 RepID=UPI0007770D58|nr:protein NDRG2-like [Coturnix japonica]